MLPETKKLPLEEMNQLFKESPNFIGNRDISKYTTPEIGSRLEELDAKHSVTEQH